MVTDRTVHSVFRLEPDQTVTRIAGNGTAGGGGDGQPAIETGLEEVRAIAFVPSGGYFVGTHRGSDVWFIDTNGIAHLFISGVRNSDPFAGEGTLASSPGNKLSEIRALNLTPAGDLIITQSDQSNIRIVENVLPPEIAPLRLQIHSDTLRLEWQTTWDGGSLERSSSLSPVQWLPLLSVSVSDALHQWEDSAWQNQPGSYLRFVPAVRWPAP